jgi:hypothetical protein
MPDTPDHVLQWGRICSPAFVSEVLLAIVSNDNRSSTWLFRRRTEGLTSRTK